MWLQGILMGLGFLNSQDQNQQAQQNFETQNYTNAVKGSTPFFGSDYSFLLISVIVLVIMLLIIKNIW